MATTSAERAAPTPTPTALEPYLKQLAPFVAVAAKVADEIFPFVEAGFAMGYKAWLAVEPLSQDFGPIVIGCLLCLFGGSLPLTIAAVEAFRLCGWDKTKAALITLWQQFKAAKAASDKDDQVDADNDGIADVKQISKQELLTRKLHLFFKVADPAKLNEGVTGVTTGCTAVIATLRSQFAQSIALGTSLGDIFTTSANKLLVPTLERIVPKEHQKWIPMIVSYSCRSLAVTIAWWCQRIISAVHSAMRGADMLLHGVFALMKTKKVAVPMGLSTSHPAYPGLVTFVATVGFYYQIARAFGLPFPLNILLLPLRIVEFVLAWTLAY